MPRRINRSPMRRFWPVILLAALPLRGAGQDSGMVVIEEIRTPPLFGRPAKTLLVKTYSRGGMLRVDEEQRSRTLLVGAGDDTIWLLNRRDFTKQPVPRETLEGMAMLGIGIFGIPSDPETGKPDVPRDLFRKTGLVRAFREWTAEKYEIRPPAAAARTPAAKPAELWIASNAGLGMEAYIGVFEKRLGDSAGDYTGLFAQLRRLGGYPVFIQAPMLGGELTQSLIRIERTALPDSVFAVPRGFRLKPKPETP
jgi:hypothetical protein